MARKTSAVLEAERNISKSPPCPDCLRRAEIWRGRVRVFHESTCQIWQQLVALHPNFIERIIWETHL